MHAGDRQIGEPFSSPKATICQERGAADCGDDGADAAAAAAAEGEGCPRRPKLGSLYDVFVCVRNDEAEHWASLCHLAQRGELGPEGERATSTRARPLPEAAAAATAAWALAAGGVVAGLLAAGP